MADNPDRFMHPEHAAAMQRAIRNLPQAPTKGPRCDSKKRPRSSLAAKR